MRKRKYVQDKKIGGSRIDLPLKKKKKYIRMIKFEATLQSRQKNLQRGVRKGSQLQYILNMEDKR